jgi:hypothetical protein
MVDAQQILRRLYGGTGPTSATLAAPAVAPPLGPRVKARPCPRISAASAVGPRRRLGVAQGRKGLDPPEQRPGGNSFSFFSTTGLTLSAGGCCATDGADPRVTIAQRNNASAAFILVLLVLAVCGAG